MRSRSLRACDSRSIVGGAVELRRDGLDLLHDRRAVRRQVRERVRLVAGGRHRIGQISRARAALREPGVDDHCFGAGLECQLADQRQFARRVGREAVDGHDAWQPVLTNDLHVRRQVVGALGQRVEILVREHVERLPTVRLGRTNGRDEHGGARGEPASAAHDVAELLEAEVAREPGFGDHVVGHLQRDAIGENRVRCVRDVAEGSRMHQRRLPLQRLHEVRLDRVLHDDGHRAGDLQHLRRHRLAVDGRRHDDAAEAAAQIGEAARRARTPP